MRVYNQYIEANNKRRNNVLLAGGGLLTAAAAAIYGAGLLADSAYGAGAASEYLEESGYSKVVHTSTDFRTPLSGFTLLGCEKGDMVKYSFDVTAPSGKHHISRVVCKGLISGPTIH